MIQKKNQHGIEMIEGSLLPRIIAFAVPLVFTGIIQLLFNIADTIVVGRFVGAEALAAIGSNTSLISLLTNLVMGMSIGVNIIVATQIGAKDYKKINDIVHTSIVLAVIFGLGVTLIGEIFARNLISLTNTPNSIIKLTLLYIRLYFLGVPGVLVYNYGSAIMRAMGDTKRPLYALLVASIINIVLNLIAVLILNMGISGVAIATIISQYISAGIIVFFLANHKQYFRFKIKKLRINKKSLQQLLRIGLPAGVQSACFSLSNTVVQSAVNTFGSITIAGNSTAWNIELVVYMAINAFYQAGVSFVSQNYGAKKYNRIMLILRYCVCCGVTVGVVAGFLSIVFGHELLSLFSQDNAIIEAGMLRITMLMSMYGLCAIMDTIAGPIRGLGYSIAPTMITLFGCCFVRIGWIFAIRNIKGMFSIEMVYWAFPVTWIVTIVGELICLLIVMKKLKIEAVE